MDPARWDMSSKQLPNSWPGVQAAGRAHMFPTHVGEMLASKGRSDPENPWKQPSTNPRKNPAPSGSRFPDWAVSSIPLGNGGGGGASGTYEWEGSSLQLYLSSPSGGRGHTAGRTNPILQPLQLGSGGIRLEALPSASILREGMQAKSKVNRAD